MHLLVSRQYQFCFLVADFQDTRLLIFFLSIIQPLAHLLSFPIVAQMVKESACLSIEET